MGLDTLPGNLSPEPPMKPRTLLYALLGLLLLTGCRAVGTLLLIPAAVAIVIFGGLAGLFLEAEQAGEDAELHAGGLRIERRLLELDVEEDGRFEGRLVLHTTVTAPMGLEAAQLEQHSYDPRTQELELVSARVVHPDGEVVEVGEDQVFDRPSNLARGAPAYVATRTRSVLYPQLTVGSRTEVEWRFEQKAASENGFHHAWRPHFAHPVVESRIVPAPRPGAEAALGRRPAPCGWRRGARGTTGYWRWCCATTRARSRRRPWSPRGNVCPRFVVSSTPNWESLGAAFHELSTEQRRPTPRVEEKAAEIVGGLEGVDAAQALHRWVCSNVRYVAVHLHQSSGWVPNPAEEVLRRGYGDCKDKVALLCALLAARGIECTPALVALDRGFRPYALPTPLQFNHVMALLPESGLYSNPTDPFRDLGELGVELSDKFVVLATEEGAVARTPAASADDSVYRVAHRATLGTDGLLRGTSVLEAEGRVAGPMRARLAEIDRPERAAASLLRFNALGGSGALGEHRPHRSRDAAALRGVVDQRHPPGHGGEAGLPRARGHRPPRRQPGAGLPRTRGAPFPAAALGRNHRLELHPGTAGGPRLRDPASGSHSAQRRWGVSRPRPGRRAGPAGRRAQPAYRGGSSRPRDGAGRPRAVARGGHGRAFRRHRGGSGHHEIRGLINAGWSPARARARRDARRRIPVPCGKIS